METPVPYKGDRPFVFISYAHKDMKAVFPVIAGMQAAGYRVWFDRGIDPGTEWDEFIAHHVKSCDYFIAFLSKNYLASSNCRDELNYARDLEKKRLLVYLEDVKLPSGMAMRLNRLQAIFKHRYQNESEFYEVLFAAQGLDVCLEKTEDKTPAAQPKVSAAPSPLSAEEAYNKALSYYSGNGVPQDYAEAVKYFRIAADQGHAVAQYSLGVCYYNGNGVPQDYAEAVRYYRTAAEQGNQNAINALKRLGESV